MPNPTPPTDPITHYFCHGVPGSSEDVTLLRNLPKGSVVQAPNLLNTRKGVLGVVSAFEAQTFMAPKPVHVIGFSLGAMAACHIAAAHPKRVARLTLVSAAAPLQLGDFLPRMAGAPVFRMAVERSALLPVVTRLQGVAARLAPRLLERMLFARCGEEERAMLQDPLFVEALRQGLVNAYARNPRGYQQLLADYVGDWRYVLGGILCPVDLWHGTNDSWAPSDMSQALATVLGRRARLRLVPGGEHYSTLASCLLPQ